MAFPEGGGDLTVLLSSKLTRTKLTSEKL